MPILKVGPSHQMAPNTRRQGLRQVFDETSRRISELRGYDASDPDVLARDDSLSKFRVARKWRIGRALFCVL